MTPFHCVTCTGCTSLSRAICPTVFTPIKASNPTFALKEPVCRLRLVLLIALLFSHIQQNRKSLTCPLVRISGSISESFLPRGLMDWWIHGLLVNLGHEQDSGAALR